MEPFELRVNAKRDRGRTLAVPQFKIGLRVLKAAGINRAASVWILPGAGLRVRPSGPGKRLRVFTGANPGLHLSGKWLAAAGLAPVGVVRVEVGSGELFIRPVDVRGDPESFDS